MSARIAALLLLFVAFGAAQALSESSRDENDAALAAKLLPPMVGQYHLDARTSHASGGGSSEELGRYALDQAGAVQVAMLTGAVAAHNAVDCHLVAGEALLSETLHTVNAAGAAATFDVALFRNGSSLSLVANTECFSDSCSETLLHGWRAQWRRLNLHSPFLAQQPAVPVSIVLRDEVGPEGSGAAQARLLGTFERFAGGLDLTPARRLAAAQ